MLNLPSVDKALRIPFSTEGKNSLNTVTGSSRIGKAHREPPDGARRMQNRFELADRKSVV